MLIPHGKIISACTLVQKILTLGQPAEVLNCLQVDQTNLESEYLYRNLAQHGQPALACPVRDAAVALPVAAEGDTKVSDPYRQLFLTAGRYIEPIVIRQRDVTCHSLGVPVELCLSNEQT